MHVKTPMRVALRRRPWLAAFAATMAFVLHARDGAATQQCKPASVVSGVDLNPDGDGTLDWAASGKGFAIIKATQGTSYTDGDFAANWAALKAAQVVRGAYHFFDATVSGVDQANFFLQVVGTIEPGDLPPTLDIECPVPGQSNCLGNGHSGAAPAAQITQGMNDFLTTVKNATGRTPIVYSYGSWFADNGVDTTGLENYPLWIADYSGGSCFQVPAPWAAATFWQYDSSGTVSGVNVDDDYFLGTAAQLSTFTSNGTLPFDGGAGDGGMDYGMCVVTSGAMGICIDTARCASEGGTSSPGFCPGPTNIQCCTGIPAHDGGAADGSVGNDAPGADGGHADGGAPDSGTSDSGAHDGAVLPGSDGGVVVMEDAARGGAGDNGGPDSGTSGSSGGCAFTPARQTSPLVIVGLIGPLALGWLIRRRRTRP
jgi:GH25 family lysozyme M1 (1,4-beta-N-acetylmuramidase)